jgi:hypothetical protein
MHPNEIKLTHRTDSNNIIATRALRDAETVATRLGKAYEDALAEQLNRQIAVQKGGV